MERTPRAASRLSAMVNCSKKSCSVTSKLIALIILSIHIALLAWGAYKHSPTIDEKAYLPAGLSVLEFARFDVAAVSPPLVKTISALPLLFVEHNTEWGKLKNAESGRVEHILGRDFVAANGANIFWLFTLARWACLPFSIIGALVCFFWAKNLYGERSAILALSLWCFSPNILAHAQMITADTAAASFALLSCYTFWLWLRDQTTKRLILAAVALGVAQLTKYTLLILYPIFFAVLIVYIFRTGNINSSSKLQNLLKLGIIFLISLFIINAGYGFSGSFIKLKDYRFVSKSFGGPSASNDNQFRNTTLGEIPLLLPKDYILGIDYQKYDFEPPKSSWYLSYLGGEVRSTGWWYYYIYAALIKIPLGTWLLLLISFALTRSKLIPSAPFANALLLLPAASILTLVSSQYSFNEHFRYILPVLGFIFIWISRVALLLSRTKPLQSVLILAPLAWSICSSLSYHPHFLSYFNELGGGGKNGHNHLIDSNIDWGQDLLLLRDWKEENKIDHFKYSYFGDIRPSLTKVVEDPDEYFIKGFFINSNISSDVQMLTPGWYALSITILRVSNFYYKHGSRNMPSLSLNRPELTNHLLYLGYIFENLEPVETIGYSIYLYNLRDEDITALRERFSELELRPIEETSN